MSILRQCCAEDMPTSRISERYFMVDSRTLSLIVNESKCNTDSRPPFAYLNMAIEILNCPITGQIWRNVRGVRLYQNPRFQAPPATLKTDCLGGPTFAVQSCAEIYRFRTSPKCAGRSPGHLNRLMAALPSG